MSDFVATLSQGDAFCIPKWAFKLAGKRLDRAMFIKQVFYFGYKVQSEDGFWQTEPQWAEHGLSMYFVRQFTGWLNEQAGENTLTHDRKKRSDGAVCNFYKLDKVKFEAWVRSESELFKGQNSDMTIRMLKISDSIRKYLSDYTFDSEKFQIGIGNCLRIHMLTETSLTETSQQKPLTENTVDANAPRPESQQEPENVDSPFSAVEETPGESQEDTTAESNEQPTVEAAAPEISPPAPAPFECHKDLDYIAAMMTLDELKKRGTPKTWEELTKDDVADNFSVAGPVWKREKTSLSFVLNNDDVRLFCEAYRKQAPTLFFPSKEGKLSQCMNRWKATGHVYPARQRVRQQPQYVPAPAHANTNGRMPRHSKLKNLKPSEA